MKRALREVIEIVADDDERGERTYRAVYTVRLADSVYVLHAFDKSRVTDRDIEGRARPDRAAIARGEEDLSRLVNGRWGGSRPIGF